MRRVLRKAMKYCTACGIPLLPNIDPCPVCGEAAPHNVFVSPKDVEDPYTDNATASMESPEDVYADEVPYVERQTPYIEAPQAYPGQYSTTKPSQEPRTTNTTPSSRRTRTTTIASGVSILFVISIVLSLISLLRDARIGPFGSSPTVIQASTPTFLSTPTTAPINTSDPQQLYSQITSSVPSWSDALNGQSTTAWVGGSINNNGGGTLRDGSCVFTNGQLHATAPAGKQAAVCVPGSTSFSNFAFQVQMTILQGNTGGIIFRLSAAPKSGYAFIIGSSGLYALMVIYQDIAHSKILSAAGSTAINSGLGQSNLLTVIARDSTIYLYINKRFITSSTDTTSSSGAMALLGMADNGSSTDVAFSNLQEWNL